ncbi:MAG: biotin/lipoyl-containing protein [Candidatus Methylomirabilia bacterium]
MVDVGPPGRLGEEILMRFVAELEGQTYSVEVKEAETGFRVQVGEEVWEVDARRPAEGIWSIITGGAAYAADVTEEGSWLLVDVDGESYRIRVETEDRHIIRTRGKGQAHPGGQVLTAPMPGKVVHIAVSEGQAVKAGDGLVVIEAMKMENEFKAVADGTVKEVRVQVGRSVNGGDVLVVIE